jgi:hypothetical protein
MTAQSFRDLIFVGKFVVRRLGHFQHAATLKTKRKSTNFIQGLKQLLLCGPIDGAHPTAPGAPPGNGSNRAVQILSPKILLNLCTLCVNITRPGDFRGPVTDQRRRAIILRLGGVVLFSGVLISNAECPN